MKNILSNLLPMLLSLLVISCSEPDNRLGVSNSNTTIYHCDEEAHHKITSYFHTIYIGNYIIRSKEDSLYLLKLSMKYVDTVRHSTPVGGITFVNSIDNFPKALDDQHADELRHKYIFTVSFNKDSLIRKKYFIDSYETWSDGKVISLPK